MSRGSVLALVGGVLILVAAALGWQRVPVEPSSASPAASDGSGLDGSVLFRIKGCASCHTGPDSRSAGFEGPDLSDAPAWAGSRRSGVAASDYLRESIREPGAFISPAFRLSGGPTTHMPTLAVSEAEVDLLVAYLLAG